MSTTLALALQLTAINGVSGVMRKIRDDVLKLGDSGKEVKREFDLMERSVTRGLRALAASSYIKSHLEPGVKAAADLQESMLAVEGSIRTTTMSTAELNKQLKEVRETAVDVSKAAPFSAKEVVDIQNSLLKAGVDPSAVTGKRGAAWAAAGLATISGTDPAGIGDMLARIGKQYNFSGKDYGSAADVLMRAEAASPGSLEEVMYSLKQFGATAKLLNVSFKDSATMAAAMAPLGLESGTAINRFILDSSGLTKMQRQSMLKLGLARMHDGKFENLLYKGGKYIGLDKQITLMREKFAAISNDQVKVKLAHDIWGQEGMRAALMSGTGEDLFGNMKKQMDEALGIEKRMEIRMKGFNMATKAAAGTIQSTLATAFDPMLGKLTEGANLVNDLADKSGKWMGSHPTATKVASGTAAAGLAALTAYGIAQLVRGGFHASRVLKGLLGTGGGIAMGKAVQAATGVTPVFITNWPKGGAGGTGGSLADIAGGAALAKGGGWLSKLKTMFAMGHGLSLAEFGASVGWGTTGAAVGGAGLAGYGAGKYVLNPLINGLISKLSGHDATLGTMIYDLFHRNEKLFQEPIKVVVDVKNGNIVASVNDKNARNARRN